MRAKPLLTRGTRMLMNPVPMTRAPECGSGTFHVEFIFFDDGHRALFRKGNYPRLLKRACYFWSRVFHIGRYCGQTAFCWARLNAVRYCYKGRSKRSDA